MGANVKYKDNMFSKLFSDPDILRELYCALENVSLPPDIPVTINTLDDVLIIDKVNDVSFEIGGKIIVLVEHQSTINPNIPRCLWHQGCSFTSPRYTKKWSKARKSTLLIK